MTNSCKEFIRSLPIRLDRVIEHCLFIIFVEFVRKHSYLSKINSFFYNGRRSQSGKFNKAKSYINFTLFAVVIVWEVEMWRINSDNQYLSVILAMFFGTCCFEWSKFSTVACIVRYDDIIIWWCDDMMKQWCDIDIFDDDNIIKILIWN